MSANVQGRDISHDLLASVVVFLVALPLCMGVAIASGVPPALGLITGIIGGIVVGSISGSPLQVSGPAAGLTVIVFEIVREHGIAALGPILIVAGLLQMVAGGLKFGQWFRAMHPAVVYGMLAGIGVLIFAAQFHVMVDDKPRSSGLLNLLSIPESVWKGLVPLDGASHHLAAGIGVLTIMVLLAWNRFRPDALKLVPGALVAVVVATATAKLLQLPIQYVDIPNHLIRDLRLPGMDLLRRMFEVPLLLEAVGVAFVASAETLLSASAVDQMQTRARTKFDRELVAQGVGNSLCGLLGALPMTGVIVRSSANVQAGAQTRLSTILHGVWLLALVLMLPFALELIPTSCLAAILVHTGLKLVDIKNIRKMMGYGRFPLVIYAATVVGIVTTDLLTGVLIGIGLSVAKTIYKLSHLRLQVLQHQHSRRVDLIMEGSASFLRLPKLLSTLESLPQDTHLVVHCEKLFYIDHAVMEQLSQWERQNEAQGARLDVEWDRLRDRYHIDKEREAEPAAVV